MNKISKEEFYKVFKDTTRENILNQFYYEHYELINALERIDKAIEYIKKYGLYEELTDYDENDNLIITGISDEKTTKDLLDILGDKENEI